MTSQLPGDSDFVAFPRATPPAAEIPAGQTPRPKSVTRASVALAVAALGFLALTVLDARSSAMLAGTLNFFGLKEVLLSAALTVAFGIVFVRVRSGHATARILTAVLSGVALWRALDFLLDVVTASVAGRLQYWQLPQFLNGGVLLLCGLAALIAVLSLSNQTASWFGSKTD